MGRVFADVRTTDEVLAMLGRKASQHPLSRLNDSAWTRAASSSNVGAWQRGALPADARAAPPGDG